MSSSRAKGLKYIKILLGRRLFMQYNLYYVIKSCASCVCWWLHIQSLGDIVSLLVWRVVEYNWALVGWLVVIKTVQITLRWILTVTYIIR